MRWLVLEKQSLVLKNSMVYFKMYILFSIDNKNYVYKRKLEDAQVNIKTLHLQKAVTYSIIPGARQNSRIYMDNLWYRYYKNRTLNCVM